MKMEKKENLSSVKIGKLSSFDKISPDYEETFSSRRKFKHSLVEPESLTKVIKVEKMIDMQETVALEPRDPQSARFPNQHLKATNSPASIGTPTSPDYGEATPVCLSLSAENGYRRSVNQSEGYYSNDNATCDDNSPKVRKTSSEQKSSAFSNQEDVQSQPFSLVVCEKGKDLNGSSSKNQEVKTVEITAPLQNQIVLPLDLLKNKSKEKTECSFKNTETFNSNPVSMSVPLHYQKILNKNVKSYQLSGGQNSLVAHKSGRGLVGLGVHNGVGQNGVQPYKRPPHTYPALIASAILDSPQNLITLRGIYDYIMNNFPYYKYCHDKSAWQNSIRHNLSLNQCFIKVPRYENAAKSNFWTMNQEGFDEFGSENSFKRRRRRGQTTPISKNKPIKPAMNGTQNSFSNYQQHNQTNMKLPAPNSYPSMAHFLALCGSRRDEKATSFDEPSNKLQKMLALERGQGPNMTNQLSATCGETKQNDLSKNDSSLKNAMHSNMANGSNNSPKPEVPKGSFIPIMMDGIQIGSEVVLQNSNVAAIQNSRHFKCAFCNYMYVGSNKTMLEAHVKSQHQKILLENKLMAQSQASMQKSRENSLNMKSEQGTPYPSAALLRSIQDQNKHSLIEKDVSDQSLMLQRQQQVVAIQQQILKAQIQSQLLGKYAGHNGLVGLNNGYTNNYANGGISSVINQRAQPFPNPFAFLQQLHQQQQILSTLAGNSNEMVNGVSSKKENATPVTVNESRHSSSEGNVASVSTNIQINGDKKLQNYNNEFKDKEMHEYKPALESKRTVKADSNMFSVQQRKNSLEQGKSKQEPTLKLSNINLKRKISENGQNSAAIKNFQFHTETKEDTTYKSSVIETSNSSASLKSSLQSNTNANQEEMDLSKKVTHKTKQSVTVFTQTTVPSTRCEYCDITFGDDAMHALHMSCHEPGDPFRCKLCGEQCNEKYFFNVHIMKGCRGRKNSVVSRVNSDACTLTTSNDEKAMDT